MATENEQIILELELINVEQQLLFLKLLRRRKERRRQRRSDVQPLNPSRQKEGEFSVLVRPPTDIEEEMHFKYIRMSAGSFDNLIRHLQPFVSHQCTYNTPIDITLRLAITIRVLASGESQQAVAASYKLALSSVLHSFGGLQSFMESAAVSVPSLPFTRPMGSYCS